MGHKVYISFKNEDVAYKTAIQNIQDLDYVDKSLNTPIESDNFDYIMRRIREDYIQDSTVTIFLIGERSNENLGAFEQRFIKRELQASLSRAAGAKPNGILGVVLPSMTERVYKGKSSCFECRSQHNIVQVNDSTVIKEFGYNYYIPNGKCSHAEDDRYCVLTTWEDFSEDPAAYIDHAFHKRSSPIADKIKVRPT